jgi:hypothetical protein
MASSQIRRRTISKRRRELNRGTPLRTQHCNACPTLVIVTDRKDLDEQIAKTFFARGFPNRRGALKSG